MHTYRYFVNDIMTGAGLGDLPLSRVHMNKRVNETGQFTGSFVLGTGIHHDQSLIDSSIPGRTALYVERDNELIWGGILWSRAYGSSDHVVQLTAQTFESYFDHVCVEANFVMQNIEQSQILFNLVNTLQAQQGNNIGLLMDPFPVTGVPRTVLIPGYEYHFASQVISQLIGVENGLEITIDIEPSSTFDRPTKTLRAGFPKLGRDIATSGLYFDYPGNVERFWWNESGARGAVKAVALGHGDGFSKVRGQAIDGGKIAAGWPAWWVVNSHPTITDVEAIAAAARNDLAKYAIPYSRPTLEFTMEAGAKFQSWNNVGDAVVARVEDYRFPAGKIFETRMLGWELKPSESDGMESLKIVVEGEDDAS